MFSQSTPPAYPPNFLYGQTDPEANFWGIYEAMENFYSQNPNADGRNDYIRWRNFWSDRAGSLNASGSFIPSMNALIEQFHAPICIEPPINGADWTLIGPIQRPDPVISNANSSTGMGVVVKVVPDNVNDPTLSTIYATTASSGLWKTTDAWAVTPQWTCLTDNTNIPTLGVQDVAIEPGASNVIYIATGIGTQHIDNKYGFGLLKSIDGGVTWETTGLVLDPLHIENSICQKILIHPTQTNIVYVLGDNRVYKSVNAGTTFDVIFDPYAGQSNPTNTNVRGRFFRDIVFKPDDPSTIYVSSDDYRACFANGFDDGAEFFISNDGGDTWTTITNDDLGVNFEIERIDIAVSLAEPDWIYLAYLCGNTRRISRSENSGETWTTITPAGTGFNPNWFKQALAISHSTADIVYLGEVEGNRSDNQGANFIEITSKNIGNPRFVHDDHRDITIVLDENGNDVVFSGHDGGVSRTTNMGTTWDDISGQGLAITQFYRLSVASDYSSITGGAQDLGFVTLNPDEGWVKPAPYNDASAVAFDPYNASQIYGYHFPGNQVRESIDGGLTWTFMMNAMGQDKVLPMNNHQNGSIYLGLEEAFRLLPNSNTWEQIGTIGNGRTLRVLEVAPSDDNIIYTGSGAVYNGGPQDGLYWKTINANNPLQVDWVDITSSLKNSGVIVGDRNKGLSDMAIDPLNPNRIWVSVTGFDKVIKVAYSDDGGDTWQDRSTGLPDFPVNAIVYQSGTNDALYVGTDVGVFYNPNGSDPNSSWECFSKELPVTIVSDMEINYCGERLVISTFGRGIWESPLATPSESIEIANDETWTTTKMVVTDVIVKTGARLTINADVYFAANKKIHIEPEAELYVIDATLTNLCQQRWQGIVVEGNAHQHQFLENGFRFQGYVFLSNAVIENAKTGVSLQADGDANTNGGVLVALKTEFKNNIMAAFIPEYENFSPNSGFPIGNLTKFTECSFVVGGGYIGFEDTFFHHVRMEGVSDIRFSGCRFANEFLNTSYEYGFERGNGIFSQNSFFSVLAECVNPQIPQGCEEVIRSEFRGLGKGIHAANDGSVHSFRVVSADFHNNFVGIHSAAVDNIFVVDSKFYVGSKLPGDPTAAGINDPSGIQIYGGTGYTVEENHFFVSGVIALGQFPIGIATVSTGDEPNEIYKNYFTGLHCANLSNGDNKGIEEDGLEYHCNENTDNSFDFAVVICDNSIDASCAPNNSGIAEIQGLPSSPTGNTFTINPQTEGHFLNHTNNPIGYYHHALPEETPTHFTMIPVNIFTPTPITGFTNPCIGKHNDSANGELDGPGRTQMEQQFYSATTEAERFYAANELLRDSKLDSAKFDYDEIRLWLSNKGSLEAHFSIVDAWLQEGQLDSAQQALNSIPTYFNLEGVTQSQYDYFSQVKNMQIQAKTVNQTTAQMVANNLTALTQIAGAGNYLGSIQAQNILNEVNGVSYMPDLIVPTATASRESQPVLDNDKRKGNVITLKAIPNPAQKRTVFHYQLLELPTLTKLEVRTVEGKVIYQTKLSTKEGQIEWEMNRIEQGIYLFSIVADGKVLKTERLVITP